MRSSALALAALLSACGGESTNTTADAAPRPDAAPSCPAPAAPLPDGMHTLFVSFEGVTLMLDACDDARTSCTSLITQGSTVVPAFLAGQGSRTARITAIAELVQAALAPFSVDVVTTRPASGDYWMVSVGGTSDAITGTPDLTVTSQPTCDAANRNRIGFVFEQDVDAQFSDRGYADLIAGAFGRLVGLVPITLSGDCMCTTATCTHTQACTWSTNAVVPPGNACDRTTQNEQALLMTAVGCR